MKTHEKWFISDEIIFKFKNSLEQGNFETKSDTVDCIFTICSYSNLYVLRKYFSSELINLCIDFIECQKGNRLIAYLKAISQIIDQIFKFGLNEAETLSSFLTRIPEVLQSISTGNDKKAAEYADKILSFYFPEIFYK